MPIRQRTETAVWRVWGRHLQTFESETGNLAICHSDGVDTRWQDLAVLGPRVHTLDLSAAGETPADVTGIALTEKMHANIYVYCIRGTKPGKVRLDTKAVVNQDTFTAFATAPTSLLKVTGKTGIEELVFGFENAAWRTITSVGTGVDTHAANSAGAIARFFGEAFPGDVVAALGRATVGGVENRIYAIELTGPVTMSAPVLTEKARIASSLRFTGFALDGVHWIPMTTRGPIYYDADFLKYRLILPETGEHEGNGSHAIRWSYLGVIYPTSKGLRYQLNIFDGGSIGPEIFPENSCPVRGTPEALAADDRWLYASFYNQAANATYIAAARPVDIERDRHGHRLSWFTLYRLPGTARCRAMRYIDTAGGVLARPELWHGNGSNLSYFKAGVTDRWIDDSAYEYTEQGSLMLSELQRYPWHTKRVRGIVIETANCSATERVEIYLRVDGGQDIMVADIRSSGKHIIDVPDNAVPDGYRIRPKLMLYRGTNATASPRVRGDMVLAYDLIPMRRDGIVPRWTGELSNG